MCGLLGIFNLNGAPAELDEAALAPLGHRGPDGRGRWRVGPVALGHTRLAIVDLSDEAGQPMRSPDGRYTLVYNGEIYNHPELRERLRGLGSVFRTRSDTEVVLAAYRHWGRDCVRHFRGMFALALWDAGEEALFLARDRCGEKPLLYYRDGARFIFASEFKALTPLLPQAPELDPSAVDLYLRYQYTPEPFTLLKGVRKLPPAHTLTLSARSPLAEPERYWNVERTPERADLPSDRPGLLRRIREALEESVRRQLRADVPVAVALSGGVDSGAIAALAQKHYPEPMHAFSVGYPGRPRYDERAQARALAEKLGLIFHEVELPVGDFVDFFPELVRLLDEPIADPAAFGHYAVPRAARELGLKALLTGLGGDELFWGYGWAAEAARVNQQPAPQVWRRLAAKLPAAVRRRLGLPEAAGSAAPDGFLRFFDLTPDFLAAKRLLPGLYGPALRELPPLNAYLPVDIGPRAGRDVPAAAIRLLFDTWLAGNCLTLGDRVSMAVGVESRMPFLDSDLIELVMALRRRVPDHELGQKAWLRAALQGVLPAETLARPKAGFQPPVWEWLGGVTERYGRLIEEGHLQARGFLDAAAARDLARTNRPGDRLFLAYKVVMLEQWISIVFNAFESGRQSVSWR